MNRAVGFIVAALLAGSGCGDNFGPPPMTPDELLARLRTLDGVTVQQGAAAEHFSYYILHFTQLLDHRDPSRGTFQQEVSLLHHDERAPSPLIVYTSGYWDDEHSTPVELTTLLDANQVSIEHRFYGESRPDTIDWSLLTVEQAAADEHEIIKALHTIYGGAFLSVGESKGGITALIHRSFYPTDVNGTVAYVAPLSFNAPDPRYSAQFDNNQIGDDDCRAAVRDLAMEMLAHRRMQMLDRARTEADQTASTYTRVKLGPAVEAAIAGLEWGFWQTAGDGYCTHLPHTTDSDETLFDFLQNTSPVSEYNDEQLGYYEPYYYQSYSQLGYPDYTTSYLTDQMWYSDVDYDGKLPTPEPAFDPGAMDRLQTWLEDKETDEHDPVTREDLGKHLLFLYGNWDPWFAGQVVYGDANKDSWTLTQKRGNHFTQLGNMDRTLQSEAFAYIQRWTGVEPLLWRLGHQSPYASVRKLIRRPPLLAGRARAVPR
jgi:hypothetical protein